MFSLYFPMEMVSWAGYHSILIQLKFRGLMICALTAEPPWLPQFILSNMGEKDRLLSRTDAPFLKVLIDSVQGYNVYQLGGTLSFD